MVTGYIIKKKKSWEIVKDLEENEDFKEWKSWLSQRTVTMEERNSCLRFQK